MNPPDQKPPTPAPKATPPEVPAGSTPPTSPKPEPTQPKPTEINIKKVLIIGLAVIVVLAGAAIALSSGNDKESDSTQTSNNSWSTDKTSSTNNSTTPPASQTPTPTPTPSQSEPPAAPKTMVITYSDSCYSPAYPTIKKGYTVKFVNESSLSMWPASADHPSHTVYPEFDADKEVAPGGSYSFTFTKVGAWDFHDHVKPSCTGTITVTV
jgi:plastocyanin